MVINSTLKNFSCALSQKQGNPKGIENELRGIIDHMSKINWLKKTKTKTIVRKTQHNLGLFHIR